MAFWGIEVKPGKPVTHTFDRVRGRLHISQATLGIGSAIQKSLVQCNVGNKSPVFLCSLLPDKTESCLLDLDFEEADQVLFSVIGPRSVYLTGYYLGGGRHSNLNNDSESCWEDIANTDTDGSTHCADEDEHEDSFIDDGNPEVFPPSPGSSDEVVDEEMLDNKKPKKRKGSHKRLKKKYQSIESDADNNSQQKIFVKEFKVSGLDSEDDDNCPISTLYTSISTERGEKVDRETSKTGNAKTEDNGSHAKTLGDGTRTINPKSQADAVDNEPERRPDQPNHSSLPSNEVGSENQTKSKKKSKERTKEGKTLESDGVNKALQDKAEDEKPATDKETDWLLPTTETGTENGVKPNKRRKETVADGKSLEGSANYNNVLREDQVKQNEVGSAQSGNDHSIRSELVQKCSDIRGIDINSNQVAYGDQSEDKNSKKKKKKNKIWVNKRNIGIDAPSLPLKENNRSVKGFEGKNVEIRPSQGRKQSAAEGKSLEGSANYNNVLREDQVKQNEVGSAKSGNDHSIRSELDQKCSDIRGIDINSNQVAYGDQPEDKNSRTKKKKSKIWENKRNIGIDAPSLPLEENNRSVKGFEGKNVEIKSSQGRTLLNGLIIHDIEMGKLDGKIAAPGKKIKVHYVGKLRENGQIFESNIGEAPYEHRLGDYGWSLGLDGMRVGGKRRLLGPPSMGYGSQGDGENIPPNSWLVFEVELVSVR